MAAEFLGKKKRQNMLELFSSSLRRMQQLRERGNCCKHKPQAQDTVRT
jgi:phage terminase Nu1 subunit (DNA packaging protein)